MKETETYYDEKSKSYDERAVTGEGDIDTLARTHGHKHRRTREHMRERKGEVLSLHT